MWLTPRDVPLRSGFAFGAGPLGIEIGQALHRLGVRVRVFGRGGAFGPLTDPVVRAAALAAIGSEMALDPDARVVTVRRDNNGVAVEFKDDADRACVEQVRKARAIRVSGRMRARPRFKHLGADELQGRRAIVHGDISVTHSQNAIETSDRSRLETSQTRGPPGVETRPRTCFATWGSIRPFRARGNLSRTTSSPRGADQAQRRCVL
jgi:hypothetical protein